MQYHYPNINQNNAYEHWAEKVNQAFSTQNLNGTWHTTFNQYIDSHTINYLSIFVNLLDAKANTQTLKEDKLSEIREQINDLLTDVLEEEDIDEHFKSYIVSYLRKITVAIEEYKISGVTPIVESIEKTLGHSFVDEKYRENFKTKTGKKIITILETVASVVTIAVGLPELSGSFFFIK